MDQQEITADLASRILDADFQNVVRKVAAGKPLTVAERARVESRAAGSTDTTTYAKTLVELASLLGVTRRTLNGWQKMDGAPKALSNGMWAVADWREFVRVRGLKGAIMPHNDEALKARKLLAEVEDRELKVSLRKGLYLLKADVEAQWNRRFAILKTLLYSKFTLELPPLCAGKDAVDLQQLFEESLDNTLREAASIP